MKRHPGELIRKKREGGEFTGEEIRDLVSGVVDGSFGDAQLGAFLMAVCCRGMTVDETSDLTLAMRDSGTVLDLTEIAGVKVDKHSTGGVGDKVSLLLAPLVAAAGIPVPMISGRGLGHTGGTIDKLQSIPGYRTDLSLNEFRSVLGDCGFVMAAATGEIAPADRRMYAIRDVTGTVESIPLITASILSKKLAEGIDALVMDVKCGRAAFMKTRTDAEALMKSIVSTGKAAGKRVTALLTNMDTPLGRAVGNALELREIVDCLRGEGPQDLLEISMELSAEMLVLGEVAKTVPEAREILDRLLSSGEVEACWRRNIERQGGDPHFLDNPNILPMASVQREIMSSSDGFVVDIDPLAVGDCAMNLGAGRQQPDDEVDPAVGVVFEVDLGDQVSSGQPLAVIHAASDDDAGRAIAELTDAIKISDESVKPGPLILGRMA